jgi:hypothetical protein
MVCIYLDNSDLGCPRSQMPSDFGEIKGSLLYSRLKPFIHALLVYCRCRRIGSIRDCRYWSCQASG